MRNRGEKSDKEGYSIYNIKDTTRSPRFYSNNSKIETIHLLSSIVLIHQVK